ncbi:MAG: exodeoxyribonuclease VII small subunit [Clostridia bacterium]|nr:exodeoxyribonuclease VII small subunit [Clostridia bacterium]MDD4386640.1 exodeoxyribonuclease VII small subunit [Clostridia bacterium]
MKNETFEKSLEELENIANELERGNLSLEKSIETFEKGIKLSKECSEKLDKAEKRINILVQTENGLEEENFIVNE